MTDEQLQQKVVEIVQGLRPASKWALIQWIRLLDVEAVPGCIVTEKPAVPGDPVEITFHGNLTIDTRDRYERRARKR